MRNVTTTTDRPKAPQALDRRAGARVRTRRREVGMSQERLGEALGITFQQVQKYEKGTNRISVSRLAQIAEALDVPTMYFTAGEDMPAAAAEGAVRLVSAFSALTDDADREQVIALAERLASARKGSRLRRPSRRAGLQS